MQNLMRSSPDGDLFWVLEHTVSGNLPFWACRRPGADRSEWHLGQLQ